MTKKVKMRCAKCKTIFFFDGVTGRCPTCQQFYAFLKPVDVVYKPKKRNEKDPQFTKEGKRIWRL